MSPIVPTETSPLLDPESQIAEHNIAGSNDGSDSRRRSSNGDATNHQGLPEVKRRMKYIFPAVAVGVSISYLRKRDRADASASMTGLPCGSRSKPCGHYIRGNWNGPPCSKQHVLDSYSVGTSAIYNPMSSSPNYLVTSSPLPPFNPYTGSSLIYSVANNVSSLHTSYSALVPSAVA
jgi:hypothetical protein